MYAWNDQSSADGPYNLRVYSDSDFAGCSQTQRSTTGSIVFLSRAGSKIPLSYLSKRQGCVSHSTPEAEIVAMDTTIRLLALPLTSIADEVFGATKIQIMGDNQGMLCVIRTGRNPTMRHLARTHRVSVAWLHEQHQREDFEFSYIDTDSMAADMFTQSILIHRGGARHANQSVSFQAWKSCTTPFARAGPPRPHWRHRPCSHVSPQSWVL